MDKKDLQFRKSSKEDIEKKKKKLKNELISAAILLVWAKNWSDVTEKINQSERWFFLFLISVIDFVE